MDYEKAYKEAINKLDVVLNLKCVREEETIPVEDIRKIFPELRESEDEKIRKATIEFVRQNNSFNCTLGISKEQVIAWLEKQGKNKDQNNRIYIQKFNIGDTVYRQGWSDNTIEKIYNDGKFEPVYICKNEEGLESHISFSEQDEWKLKDRMQSQPKQEWSEEDEDIINHLIKICSGAKNYNQFAGCSQNDITKYQNWLKSLKERVQPQSMQAWSKEDEKHIESIIACLKEFLSPGFPIYKGGVVDEINWLKSIKPNHWKPSKDQLFALRMHTHENPNLESLYDELKSL